MKNIALVLPAYNLGGIIRRSLNKIREGVGQFPEYNFKIYITDDKSEDNTLSVIENWMSECELQVFFHPNEENSKLVKTLKKTYERALQHNPDYILKIDLDEDFDQTEVMKTLLPYATNYFIDLPIDVAIGVRCLTEEKYSEHEQEKRKEIRAIIENKVGYIKDKLLDPASVGSQLYRSDALRVILDKPVVKSFEKHSGLDFLIPLVAYRSNFNIKILGMTKSKYDINRRENKKVDDSYNVYHEIIYLYEHGF